MIWRNQMSLKVRWIDVLLCLLLASACGLQMVLADTPANCTYEDARGVWEFGLCEGIEKCSSPVPHQFKLLFPNIAYDGFGNRGTWTLIYNQGFEVTVAHRKWLVMFYYNKKDYSCDHGLPSLTHDDLIRQWKWFLPRKIYSSDGQQTVPKSISFDKQPETGRNNRMFRNNHEFINQINSMQSSWTAAAYPQLEKYTVADLRRRAGGSKSVFRNQKTLVKQTVSRELQQAADALPEQFDWRSPPDGRPSPVTPVRNQLSCGSCYAFAAAGAFESRLQLQSNFTVKPILSPQEIVDCGKYSEGCEGGFPYLVAGKYAQDYGLVEESCDPYTGKQSQSCSVSPNCTRYYTTNYEYIGGYYGACNEMLMKMELVKNGPFPVGFEVYDDFEYYHSGIYRHVKIADNLNRFDPFELTNHAVILVGYGVENKSGIPFWIVKNSWGKDWGENGFFRIYRGTDECAIESLGVRFDVVI